MTNITLKTAARQEFMPLMRELVRTYQAFASVDADLHRSSGFGLTVSQADVVFTLGNTQGMTCSEIGDRTLITKGTLTGVIDRLETKGLVKRTRQKQDRRCIQVSLTPEGEAVFSEAFPQHVVSLKRHFDRIEPAKRKQLQSLLSDLRSVF